MTGAPVPAGADAVVPYEWTDRGVAQVRIDQAPDARAARPAGRRGRRGRRRAGLRAAPCSGRATSGCSPRSAGPTVRSRPRPRVVVISTGSELRDPGTPLGRDSIYDGNSFLLAAAARAAGAIAYRVGIVPDEPRAFLDALHDQLVRADLVVTSGGVSQGDYDVVKEALRPLGTVWFGPVAMQPGKPQGFGHVGDGPDADLHAAGQPGLVVRLLRAVRAAGDPQADGAHAVRPADGARPGSPTRSRSPAGREQLVRAEYDVDAAGPCVTPVGGHGSHLIGDLAASNALVVVPADVTAVAAGEQVRVLRLDEEF